MAKHEEESLDLPYDCFISFRGEDERYKFVGHLREGLRRKGINSFIDDRNMEIGERISNALSKAIEESRIFIIVLSENYASSKWCLDELVQILERSRDKKQRVYPIFYHVDPSDVRNQRDRYGEHMIEHEKKFGKESQKVQAWRSALSEVGGLPGKHIKNAGSDRYESDLIEEIVEKVNKYIAPKHLHVGGRNPVGLEPRLKEVKSLLDTKPDDVHDVRMLGIHGLGGIGKTELVKALYNNIVRDFDAASFLADVREKSNNNLRLEDLQKTLLSQMKEELVIELGSTYTGMYEIKRRLRQKKVLLVLDDVDDKEQLEKLAGGRDWFGQGSRIIITTRDKDVLLAHQVEEMYEMKELDESHSLELFCWYAFDQSQPEPEFKDMSLRAIGFAKRLPLALTVIGSDLALKKTSNDWESALKDYEKNHRIGKIHGVLQTSYDRLDDDPKQVFLDIACFFKGEKKEYVENILDQFGASTNIKVLCRKSLLTIDDDGCLKMHDLIQDMGRYIVKQEASDPGERSRLWDYDDIIDILTHDSGSKKIEGIMLDPPQREKVEWSGTAFEKMTRLRILIVRNTSFSPEPEYLPYRLLNVLDWEEYPSKSFPLKFHPKKIVVFNLPKSHLTLQEPFKEFSCLIKMDFSHNQSITEIPDVSKVQNLREMRLDNCRELVAVHESVGFLKKLAHLSTSGCTKLRKFPQTMFLPSLEVLDLNLCASLEHFPEIKKEMKTPLDIYMINTSIQELPESIGKLTGLVSIEISNSRKLKYLPSSLFMLPNVVSFKIEGCSLLRESFRCFMCCPSEANVRPTLKKLCFTNANLSDEDLLAILYCFPKLVELIVSGNNFVSLPAYIKECDNLTSLDVNNCGELENIPECNKLRVLDVHGCQNLEEISKLPSTIQKVDARYCFSLTRETSDMLWFQVKEIRGMEVVMPFKTEFHADLFNFETNGGNPQFWVRRGKFPNIALALVFHFQDMNQRKKLARRQVVDLRLLINGQLVHRKGHYNFIIEENHVLICDLGRLFSEEEWYGLDAFLKREWNVVQVLYEATSTLSVTRWGAYVYREEGTNMEDAVQFTCPNPECSDTPPTEEVAIKDQKQELRMMINNLGLDLSFEKTMAEYLNNQERGGFAGHKECMDIVLAGLNKISKQARGALNSNDSALEDPKSELRWLLDTIKNDDGEHSETEVVINGELALIRLKDPLRLEGYNNGYDPEQQRIQKIFREGMTEGLVEAQKSFPCLNIVKTRRDAIKKVNRDGILFDIPKTDCTRLQLSVETGLRIEGIVNALLEAKLSFPDLDVWATLDAILCRNGMEGLHWRLRPFLSIIDEVNGPIILDPVQEEIMRKLFWKGMTDGLDEARQKFPSLDIDGTRSVALNNVNIDGVARSLILQGAGNPQLPPVEIRMYTEGVVYGLYEAKLSFPDLDVLKTLNTLLSKRGMNGFFEAPAPVPPSVPDNRLVEALRNMYLSDRVGETSNTGHQEDPQVREQKMRKIFCDGMTDGLVEARNIFPSLDIDRTISASLNKGNSHRIEWPLSGPPGYPPMSDELKMYIEGIFNGLREAKLSFPDLDSQAIFSTVYLRTTFAALGLPPLPDCTVLKERAEELGRQYDAAIEVYQNSEEFQDLISATYLSGLRDGLLEAHATYTDQLVHCTAGHNCETKYEKMGDVLKGRVEELGRQYEAEIEGFQNSEECDDLMSATYLNGLRDGLLQAQQILLPFHV